MIAARTGSGLALIDVFNLDLPLVLPPPPYDDSSDPELDLFDVVPHFAQPPTISGNRGIILTKLGPAAANLAYAGSHAVHTLHFEFLQEGMSEIALVEDFFFEHAGKWKPFWVPSWHRELIIATDISAEDSSIAVTSVDYETNYGPFEIPTRLGNRIFLFNEEGDFHTSKVESATTGDPNDTMELETPPTADFPAASSICGFLYHVRFSQDDLQMTIDANNRGYCSLAMREFIRVTSEADV